MNVLRNCTVRYRVFRQISPITLTPLTNHGLQKRHASTVESVIQTQSGIFKSISESTPVEYLQSFLVHIHDTSGLPWWATIITTTVILRSCVTVPLAIYQQNIMAKVENCNREMPAIVEELKKEMAVAIPMYKWDERMAKLHYKRTLKREWNNLIVRDNCHPFKASILLWVQIPMWICFSASLRNIVYQLPKCDFDSMVIFTELTLGGFGWIPNLTVPDSSLILPVTLGLINLAIIELQSLSKVREPSKFQRYILNFFRLFSVGMIPIAAGVPSSLALYWTASSAFGLAQNLVLLSPKVKRFCRIPQASSELQNPYEHVMNGIKNRWYKIPGLAK